MFTIKLDKINEFEWIFHESKNQVKHYDKLYLAEELMEDNQFEEAKEILQGLLGKTPECIEAYNDMYLCLLYLGKDQASYKYLKTAVVSIMEQLPDDFLSSKDQKLSWCYLENRPFLRVIVNLGNEYLARGKFKQAQNIFEQVLQWNPDDNQGVRELVLFCYFELGLLDKVVEHCSNYPDDIMVGIVYAKPLVYFLKKQTEMAKQELHKAIDALPRVANELIKSRHKEPATIQPGFRTIGGEDEAYQYWCDFGKYWRRAKGAIAFVKQNMK